MASDKRLLPSGVIPPRRRPGPRAPPARFFVIADDDAIPPRASIARTIRSLSAFSSDKIFCKSKVCSFRLADRLKLPNSEVISEIVYALDNVSGGPSSQPGLMKGLGMFSESLALVAPFDGIARILRRNW